MSKNGLKLNENALALADGQRSTKAVAKYVRGSASKVRVVLDLIRGLDVRSADEVLQFTERAAAADVRKVLASAVANAVHNDNQDVDELYVIAAFADEGPTLKRFRPRARGRASRIRKRSSHITVIVARMPEARLEIVQNRRSAAAAGRRGGLSPQSRADRVARSRARAQGAAGEDAVTEATTTDEVLEDVTDETLVDAVDTTADETSVDAAEATAEETTETTDATEADSASAPEASTDENTAAEDATSEERASDEAESSDERSEEEDQK